MVTRATARVSRRAWRVRTQPADWPRVSTARTGARARWMAGASRRSARPSTTPVRVRRCARSAGRVTRVPRRRRSGRCSARMDISRCRCRTSARRARRVIRRTRGRRSATYARTVPRVPRRPRRTRTCAPRGIIPWRARRRARRADSVSTNLRRSPVRASSVPRACVARSRRSAACKIWGVLWVPTAGTT